MAEHFEVAIDTSNDNPQPTLEELAAKMDEQAPPPSEETPDTATEGDRPEWLPEKFKSAEDMAKAYAELEKKIGQKAPEATQDQKADENTDQEDGDATPEEQANEAAEKAGLDLDELSTKYWENGQLDDSDYESLEKAGYPKHIVEQFIKGQEAQAALIEQQVFSSVGGQEEYNAMLGWASDELSPGEVKAFNKAVNSGDIDEINAAVKGLKARYDASVGYEPTRQIKSDGKSASDTMYRSVAELQKDMGDPRYKNDPAFRKDVEAKLGRSNIF